MIPVITSLMFIKQQTDKNFKQFKLIQTLYPDTFWSEQTLDI